MESVPIRWRKLSTSYRAVCEVLRRDYLPCFVGEPTPSIELGLAVLNWHHSCNNRENIWKVKNALAPGSDSLPLHDKYAGTYIARWGVVVIVIASCSSKDGRNLAFVLFGR